MLFNKPNTDFLLLLRRMAENAAESAQCLRHAVASSRPAAEHARIEQLRRQGNELADQVLAGLHKVFIPPLDREDLLDLVIKLDKVNNYIEAAAACFEYLNLTDSSRPMELAGKLDAACQSLCGAFRLLNRKEMASMLEHLQQIRVRESEAEQLLRASLRELFRRPKEPYHIFKVKELYEQFVQPIRACKETAWSLELIIMKYG